MANIEEALLAATQIRPYYQRALAALTPIEKKGLGTVGVDKYWRLYYDPDFLEGLTPKMAGTIIAAHEIEHLLREHSRRQELCGAEPKVYNIAGDAAINDELTQAMLPEGCVFPKMLGMPDGLIEEEYLDAADKHKQKQECKCGSGAGGEPIDGELEAPDKSGVPGIEKGPEKQLLDEVANAVVAHAAKKPGTVPAGTLIWANTRAAKPKPSWRTRLQAIIGQHLRSKLRGRSDYSWAKIGRRAFHGVLTPGTVKSFPTVSVIVDTSGSMSEYGPQVLGYLQTVLQTCKTHVITCDTVPELVPSRKKIKFKGGGGTDLRPAFEMARKQKPNMVIVITDCETPWPDKMPCPVIAVACGQSPAPSWIERVQV